MELEDTSSGDQSISDEQYNHYVEQRTAFGRQARREVAAEHYPGKELCTLTKKESTSMLPGIFSEPTGHLKNTL